MPSAAMQIYFALPTPFQNLALTGYGVWLRYLRYGREHSREVARLRESQWLSKEELERRQLRDLERVLDHAWRTVPLYRERPGKPSLPLRRAEWLRDLPLLRKDDLRAPRAHLISPESARGRIREVHTGGTTGKPLTIYCDRPTLQRNFAFFARFREWMGVGPRARTATFAGRTIVAPEREDPPFWRRNLASRQLLLSSYHISPDTAPAYLQALRDFKPEVIDSYPSSLYPLARWALERGLPTPTPRGVIMSSETLSDRARSDIERAFRCRVFDHYGAAEMAALITQCEHGTYHVNPEFGFVELLTEEGEWAAPGEAGEIVATGFINPVMPLVRYATGDRAVAGAERCACGRHFPVVEAIQGRMDDVLITPEGRRVGRLDPIFKSVSSIVETRIVQDRSDHIRVEYVAGDVLAAPEAERLRSELGRRLGPTMHVDLVRVDRVPREASGKLRTVVRELTTSGEA